MLYLAFYKGGNSLFDKLTAWRTNGVHTHCELAIPELPFASPNGKVVYRCFSSSQWDGGSRFKTIDFYPPTWDLVEVHGCEGINISEWCMKENGCKYDWTGVLSLSIGAKKEDPKKWFCSEICLAAIQSFNKNYLPHLVPWQTSPEQLYQAVQSFNNGFASRLS